MGLPRQNVGSSVPLRPVSFRAADSRPLQGERGHGASPVGMYGHPCALSRQLSGSRLLPLWRIAAILRCPLPVHPRTEAPKSLLLLEKVARRPDVEGTPKKFPPGPVEWVTAVRKPRKYRLGWFKRKAYPGNYPKGSPPHPAPRRGHPLQQERAWGFPVGMYGHPYYSGQLVFGRRVVDGRLPRQSFMGFVGRRAPGEAIYRTSFPSPSSRAFSSTAE